MSSNNSKRRKLNLLEVVGSADQVEAPNKLDVSLAETEVTGESTSRIDVYRSARTSTQNQDHVAKMPFTSEEHRSELFQLQVDELLKEMRPSEKKLKDVKHALYKLKSSIENIETRAPLSISEASRILRELHHITIPFPVPKPNENLAYKLVYETPVRVNVVGSYTLNAMIKSKSPLGIDLIVVMPDSIFQKKDFLNYRYFYKRAYYIACIAAGLESSTSEDFDFRFEYLHNNDLHPILVAKPKSKTSNQISAFEIRVIPTVSKSLFSLRKLRPDKNSIRLLKGNDSEIKKESPTPFYNSSLTSDCNFESYLNLLHNASRYSKGFRDACILGRIWLRQRGFSGDICGGGFGHFEWASLSAVLLRGELKEQSILSIGYSSAQMFKSFLQFLSVTDLASKPVITHSTDISLQKSIMPLFYDGLREHNILYKMSPWSYNLLRQEAKSTLDMLRSENFNHFDSTFIMNISQPLLRFDCMFSMSSKYKDLRVNLGDHISCTRKLSSRLYNVLRLGFADRLSLIQIKEHPFSSWSTKSPGPLHDESIIISVVFDPVKINRLVDHGPPAEDEKTSATFREFWGPKSELRRFKDGRILESLVWEHGTANSLFESILVYLIERHWDSETARSISFIGGNIESFLPDALSGLRDFEAIRKAFESLESQIRSLDGLPLQLKQLSKIDSQLRFTSVVPLFYSTRQYMMNPADVLIEFEGSGRWPDDLVAIQRTKVALLLRIKSLLEKSDTIFGIKLGLENESQLFQNCAFLDVTYQTGFVFRLRVHCEREQTLLQRQVRDKSVEKHTRDDAARALSIYKRVCVQLPLLAQSITTNCTRFPLLSATIRLVKHWFNRHMILRHFNEEIIELIVARTFLHPYPWQPPSSLMTAFLRTILFLSKWDWKSTPLIIDFSGTITKIQLHSIYTQMEAWRKIDPALNRIVIFAASNHDLTGTAFSTQGPSKMIAARMTTLAYSTYKLVKDNETKPDFNSIFTTSISEYDFIIYLSKNFTTLYNEKKSKQLTPKNLELQSETKFKFVGYQPVQLYIAELENLYSNHVIFFYENFTGSMIAGLWNPQSMSPRSFKASLSYSTRILEKCDVVIDQTSILAEIARLGGDMIEKIIRH